jgi:hypothetical protein
MRDDDAYYYYDKNLTFASWNHEHALLFISSTVIIVT